MGKAPVPARTISPWASSSIESTSGSFRVIDPWYELLPPFGGCRAGAGFAWRRGRTGRFASTFREEDALPGVLCGYGFSFVFFSSHRHFAASAGLPQAS